MYNILIKKNKFLEYKLIQKPKLYSTNIFNKNPNPNPNNNKIIIILFFGIYYLTMKK